MGFCDTGSARLAYQQLGEGPDVVLIHGLATSRAFWYVDLAQTLKADYRVTLYDLRGHGYSERTEAGYTAAAMAEDLRALLDHLHIERAHIVGHSYGGGVGLEFAVRYPQRVACLAVLDTKINRLQPQQWLHDTPHLTAFEHAVADIDSRDWSAEPQLGLAYLESAARLCVAGNMPTTRDIYTPFGQGRSGRRAARQFLKLVDETTALQDFVTAGAAVEQLAALPMPVLMMYGAYSHCLKSAWAFRAARPQTRLVTVEEAGHFFPASHGDMLASRLLCFLDEARPAALTRTMPL